MTTPSRKADASTEPSLIAAAQRGEARAMEALYHQYKQRVYGVVHRIVGSNDADEVSQEAFVRVFRGLPAFRGDAQLGTWIYRLAVNAALSHLAKVKRRRETSDDVLAHLPGEHVAPRDPKLVAHVEAAMASLPAGYRAILVLHDVEGLSHEECAAILDCSIGTCKSQLHKARGKLRERLTARVGAQEFEA